MTRYAKINFPLQVSSTSSYGDQLLTSDIPAEEFTCTKVMEGLGAVVDSGSSYFVGYNFPGWTTIRSLYIRNHSTSTGLLYLDFSPDGISQDMYVALNPGESNVLSNIGVAATIFSYAIAVETDTLASATYDLIVLGD